MVPPNGTANVWASIANYTQPNHGNYGDYGAFGIQFALSDFPLFGGGDDGSGLVEKHGGGDDGQVGGCVGGLDSLTLMDLFAGWLVD